MKYELTNTTTVRTNYNDPAFRDCEFTEEFEKEIQKVVSKPQAQFKALKELEPVLSQGVVMDATEDILRSLSEELTTLLSVKGFKFREVVLVPSPNEYTTSGTDTLYVQIVLDGKGFIKEEVKENENIQDSRN